jgi:hypothetical protein
MLAEFDSQRLQRIGNRFWCGRHGRGLSNWTASYGMMIPARNELYEGSIHSEGGTVMKSVQIMLGAVAILVLSACSSHHHHMGGYGKGDVYWQKGQQDMAGLIDKAVKDPAKAQQVKAVMEEIVAEIKTGREQVRAYHQQVYVLNADYNATPEAFTKILDEANNNRMRSGAKIISLRFKMKELMTAEEWKTLSDGMMAYGNRYRQGADSAPKEQSGY